MDINESKRMSPPIFFAEVRAPESAGVSKLKIQWHECIRPVSPPCAPVSDDTGQSGTVIPLKTYSARVGPCTRTVRSGKTGKNPWRCQHTGDPQGRFQCGLKAGAPLGAPAGRHRPAMRGGDTGTSTPVLSVCYLAGDSKAFKMP